MRVGMTYFSRLFLFALGAVFAMGNAVSAQTQRATPEPSAVGLWEHLDDSTGKPDGWFRIVEKNGTYEGILVKAFPKPEEEGKEWLCTKCEGAEKNAPVVGLSLIKNMKRTGLKYQDGTIMDPRDGAVYKALMELSPDGQKLTVRGFLGIALFGKDQIWNRLPDTAMDSAPAPGAPGQPAGPAPGRPATKKAKK